MTVKEVAVIGVTIAVARTEGAEAVIVEFGVISQLSIEDACCIDGTADGAKGCWIGERTMREK